MKRNKVNPKKCLNMNVCFIQALQSKILLSLSGKFIPYIFMEFGFIKLPENETNCPEYKEWVELFFLGGYMPANPGITNIWIASLIILFQQP